MPQRIILGLRGEPPLGNHRELFYALKTSFNLSAEIAAKLAPGFPQDEPNRVHESFRQLAQELGARTNTDLLGEIDRDRQYIHSLTKRDKGHALMAFTDKLKQILEEKGIAEFEERPRPFKPR
jgi:hypothetical protein